jgi:coiled-coil domain-containing protein 61
MSRLLVVDATNVGTSERWGGSFAPSYVEEMTHRAGNFKEFAIFARMVVAAMKGESDCLRIDLLTYTDL